MKRKINKVGPGTLTVSLPKKWVEKQRLKKGDEVEVDERGSLIMISGSRKQQQRKLKAKILPHERAILRILYHAYKSGIDEVELSFDDKECIKLVEENIDKYIGFEIIEQTDTNLIVKSITEINEKDFEKTFKRLFDITLFFSKKVYENLKEANFDSLSNTVLLEKTQNKLYLFCLRALNLFRETLIDIPTFYYLLVQGLEDIGDSYKFICEYYSKNQPKNISKESLNFFQEINTYLELLHQLYYDFDMEKNTLVLDTFAKLKEKTKKLLLSQSKEDLYLLAQLDKTIVNIVDASSPIFGINFDKFIQTPQRNPPKAH